MPRATAAVTADEPAYPVEARTIRESHEGIPRTDIGKGGSTPIYRFADVLNAAYQRGFLGFGEPTINIHPGAGHKGGPLAVVVATGQFIQSDGSIRDFYGTGDASPENCGSLTGPAFVRMAETRAQGRLLNRAMNLNAVMAEELFEEETTTNTPQTTAVTHTTTNNRPKNDPAKYPEPNDPNSPTGYSCEECGATINKSGDYEPGMRAFFSKRTHGRILCWDHQKAAAA